MTTPGAPPPRDARIILDEILASIAMIQSYLTQVARDQFMAQPLIQDGVVRDLKSLAKLLRSCPLISKRALPLWSGEP